MKALSVVREIIFYLLNVTRALTGLLFILLGLLGLVALGVLGIEMFKGTGSYGGGFAIFVIVMLVIILIIPIFVALVAYFIPVIFAVLRMTFSNPKAKFAFAIVNAALLLIGSGRMILSSVGGLFNGLTDIIQSNSSSNNLASGAAATLFASIVTFVAFLVGIIRLILSVALLALTLIVDIHMLKYGEGRSEEEYEIGELDEYYSTPEPEMPDFYFGYEETTESESFY